MAAKVPGVGIGKRNSPWLPYYPAVAEHHLWVAAKKTRHLGLVLLLVKYVLEPEEALKATLTPAGLQVETFEEPLWVADEDRPVLEEWLARSWRPHQRQVVINYLNKTLRQALIAELEQHERSTGEWTGWRVLLRTSLTDLKRLARELAAESCGYDEATYRELVHNLEADPDESLHTLVGRSRRILSRAAEAHARAVAERMAQLCRSGTNWPD